MSRDPREDETGLWPSAPDGPRHRLSRRRVLSLGAVGAVAAGSYAVSRGPGLPSLPQLAGLGEPTPPELHLDPEPVDFRDLQARQRIGSAVHVYEVTARPSTFYVTESFGARLDRWLALHRRHVGQTPDEIGSYGAWVAGPATSWHRSGEAMDIARLRTGGRDLTSLRYDQWR